MNMILLKNKGFKDINPIECGEEYCSSTFRAGPTSRQYFLLHFVFSGKGTFFTEKNEFAISKGQMFVMHPHETVRYNADPKEPWHYCWVGFEKSFNTPVLDSSSVISLHRAEHIFNAIKDSEQMGSQKEIYIAGKIFEMISIVEQSSFESNKSYEYVRRAKQFIDINYAKNINIESIADELNINRSYFSSIFRRYEGKSPQKYLIDIRLANAAELISNHGYSVSDAASVSGYSDIFNFSKAFKSKYGVAPSHYKRNGIFD